MILSLSLLVSGGDYETEVLRDQPVAYWRLGERDLLEPLLDATGNGHDGRYDALGHTGLEAGQPGAIVGDDDTAVRFQTTPGFGCGDCGRAEVPPGGLLDLGFEGGAMLTLEAWFQLLPGADAVLPASAFPRLLHYNSEGGRYAFGIVGDDTAGFPDSRTVWAAIGGSEDSGIIKAAPCGAIWPGDEPDWFHLVATIDSTEAGTSIRLFLNGEELADLEDSDPIYWSGPQATIGSRVNPGTESVQGFPGLIDELAVYDSILPDERIRAHFKLGRPAPEARVTAQPTIGAIPLRVELDGSASTPPAGATLERHHWRFGDGATAEGARVEHVYERPGIYLASLRVTSSLGTTDHAGELVRAGLANQDVSPFIAADIGDPPVPGGAVREGDCLIAWFGGGDVGRAEDACHFLFQERSGDFALTVKVADLTWQPAGRAAVMFRTDLNAAAPMAAISYFQERQAFAPVGLGREFAQAIATPAPAAPPFVKPELHLRMARSSDWLVGSISHDGASFAEVARWRFDGLQETLLAGFAVSGRDVHATGRVATIAFCDIAFEPAPPPLPLFHRGDADGLGDIDLSDAIRILGFLFLGDAVPPCLEAADADDSGELQITDAVFLLGYLFLGAAPPPPPGPPAPGGPCGVDPGWTHLGCKTPSHC
jgi:hypothetical protein